MQLSRYINSPPLPNIPSSNHNQHIMAQFPHFPFISQPTAFRCPFPPLPRIYYLWGHQLPSNCYTFGIWYLQRTYNILQDHTAQKRSFCVWGITTLQSRTCFPPQKLKITTNLLSPTLAAANVWAHDLESTIRDTHPNTEEHLLEKLSRTLFVRAWPHHLVRTGSRFSKV